MVRKKMIFSPELLLNVLLLTMFATSVYAGFFNETKPGCPSKCGNVTIPYPFGIGDGCYFDKGFEITCNSQLSEPYLAKIEWRVLEISSEQVYVDRWTSSICYNSATGTKMGKDTRIDLRGSPFTLSRTHNKVTVVGCDIYGYINDLHSQSGCISMCDTSDNYTTNGLCYGFGCCQASISIDGLRLFNVGYLCECSPGYEGNPYLPDGCHGGFNCSYQIPKTNKGPPMVIDFTGIGTGMLLLILLAVAFWLCRKYKNRRICKLKQKFFVRNGGILLEQQTSSGKFLIEELERATDNFNESRILGRGGSGTVYKGMLPDGRIVAIKKSKLLDETQIGQFINKLVILSEIKHRNIVQVMGCCLETEVPLLVYEFVSRGTLSEHRHDISLVSSISGEDRLRISKVIAGALSYLHSSVSTPIFHRDIKSSNILLDENFKAKYQTLEFQDQYPTSK
ncbi:hypothetical protein GIB67_004066 [Kingdonia uniflora]|uniref:Protein kinase domain-containing protein n=2 Tax=Kingdonia uniflora TaxID=39325 RepID=A0A7J7NRT0_9MAGN|nr:hypothetical protein GIB67_004066 [Kingdonia uniflora]